ncbi:Protein of unknown function [Halobacillus karajensis]|uniref:LppM domain-containing protein n=1 Tax=Halobacillus karajensis TaxID=195088 RepID=A0A059NZ82_9BACI|nr:DUF3153 domain-containing protein [Halobacillus karajensis]CDQ18541.1 hypothetical protein BN982_00814 [Halobacillus karajensis]CDQ23387.1 hypothetical protein BN983_01614 [Halobacillus karajensis]CDQ26869.1 hypothetical protein BN981_01094 [Halobacillus karajensis]SEH50164.1 Protein of unknown function [Halobacillus karajensis]
MRKLTQVVIFLLLIGLLSACVEGDLKLKVNKDGSGEHTVTVGAEEETLNRFGDRVQDLMENVNKELESKGYEVESYKEDGYSGFRAKKSFEDVRELDLMPVSGSLKETGAVPAIGDVPINMTTEGGFFTSTYKVEAELDLANSGVMGGMQSLVADQLDLTFTLDLPLSPKAHNADRVKGDVLQWDIQAAGTTNIMVEMVVPNLRNIAITVISALVVLALLIVLIRKRKKAESGEKQ